MNQKLPLWIRSLLFVVIFGLLYSPVQKVITKPYDSEVYVVERMIDDHEDFDVLIMGSSHGYCTFDPKILDVTLENTNTYNLSIPNLNFAHMSLLLQQLIEEDKAPNILILETYSITSAMKGNVQVAFFNGFSKTWQPDYLFEILDYYPVDEWIYPLSPLIYQHENWKNPDIINLNLQLGDEKNKIVEQEIEHNNGYQHQGFRPFTHLILPEAFQFAVNDPETLLPTDENVLGLERILKLSEENGIQLIFVLAPYPGVINGDFSQIDQTLEASDLAFYNFNQLYPDLFNILHYLDPQHLNAHGAVNGSLLLSEIISGETDRKLLLESIADYQRLNLAEIRVEESGDEVIVTLIPEDPSVQYEVDWLLRKENKTTLVEQFDSGMQFSFPASLLQTLELELKITYQLPGLDYSITLIKTFTE